VLEGAVLFAGWWIFLPGRPLWFASAWWAVSFFLNRGLRPTWIVARAIGARYLPLLADIHLRPLLAASVTAAAALVIRESFDLTSWLALALAAAATGALHLSLFYAAVLSAEHRDTLWAMRPALLRARTAA
jgi:hypothetical protein